MEQQLRVGFVDAGGVNTRYLHAGSGPVLVLLHGVGMSADIWFKNIPHLARSHRVIALDMLNHGFTDLAPYEGCAPQQKITEHILACLDALGIDKFSVAGSSFGGQLAALVYFAVPARIENLVIIGSGTSFNPEAEFAASLARVLQTALQAYDDPTWESCRKRMESVVYTPSSVPDELLLSQLTSYARPGMAEAYKATLAGMMDLDLVRPFRLLERVEQLRARTLIVWGRQDIRGAVERALAASRVIPDCAIEVFEECGHFPHLEHPQRFNQIVADFLNG
ncbi:alpha/beta hydrolase [Pusillimonas caeni]|uniref:alpha/beta fold hydrolase n=1 Tax=Pusillimonas caeni TaxID=1348472 RepID=UPI000E59EA8B|nr:alpha/beta hydrolase [Pusillimonas caeni]TFL14775.1 alpha/beta hydrolase [Pusillimonas caeni]